MRRTLSAIGVALGDPYYGSTRKRLRYNLGDSRAGLGPLLWILVLRLDPATGRVVSAKTHTEPY